MPSLQVALDAREALQGAADFNRAKDSVKRGAGEITDSTGKAERSVGLLGGAFGKILALIGPLAAGFSAIAVIGKSLSLAGEFEKTNIAFETMLGSAEKAKSLIQEITDFTASTPFQSEEVTNAAKSLLAFNTPAEDLIDTLRQLGDLSAGVGAPIGELAELFGKARVQGRLMAEDINQLTGRGIPVIQEFAKQFGVAESQVRKLVEEGRIGFPQLQKAIADLTAEGSRFGGLTAKQAESFPGLFSTLKDNVLIVLRDVGTAIIDELNLKGLLASTIEITGEFGPVLVQGFRSAVDAVKPFAFALSDTVGAALRAMLGVFDNVLTSIRQLLDATGLKGLDFADVMKEAADLVLITLVTMQFGFENWEAVTLLLLLKVGLGVSKFADGITDIFTRDIPAVLQFLLVEWRNIFTDLGEIAVTVFENLVDKVANLMLLLKDVVTGKLGVNEALAAAGEAVSGSLLKGFRSSIGQGSVDALTEELSTTRKSEVTARLEQEIGVLSSALSTTFDTFVERKLKDLGVAREATTGKELLAEESQQRFKGLLSAITGNFAVRAIRDAIAAGGPVEAIAAADSRGKVGPQGSVDVSGRFIGLAASFAAQNQPLNRVADATERTAKNTEKNAEATDNMAKSLATFTGAFSALFKKANVNP